MINSIRNFIEKETYEIENIMRKFVEGELELDTFGKELLLPLGRIRFKRTCYTSKKTGKTVYLLDQVISLGKHQRITMGAAAAILGKAVESSCRGVSPDWKDTQ